MSKPIFAPTRRQFLLGTASVGGGFCLGLPLAGKSQSVDEAASTPVNLWVEIRPDNQVVLRYARCEMGQGSLTSAPQLIAEELDANWDDVRIEYVDVNEHIRMDNAWGDMSTVGSRTIRGSQEYLRQAGATARAMLVAAAAELWEVPAAEITVSEGRVRHADSQRESGFGALAERAARQSVPSEVSLKDPADWRIIGRSVKRVDIPASVDGSQVYGIDIRLPGMVYAAMAQCPVFGGSVREFDDRMARRGSGVIDIFTIDDGKALAVVARNWWAAQQALKSIEVNWDTGENGEVNDASIHELFRNNLSADDAAPLPNNRGNADEALAGAATVLEADYVTPYLSHSPMEPMGATVQINEERVDLWVSTQSPVASTGTVAEALGIPPEQVYLHRVQAGGGFGRRGGADDYSRAAALIAQRLPAGTPVKLLWTREEDTQHDYYRPFAMYRLRGALDAEGRISAWTTRIASGSLMDQMLNIPLPNGVDPIATEGFNELPYEVENQHHDFKNVRTHVPIGFWRTVGWSQTPFAREQFIDELAAAAGEDPYAFRRKHMREDHLSLHILNEVARAAGWDGAAPEGIYRGIATTEPYGSYTAAVVELSVNDSGGIKLNRVILGINPGHVVNPDNVRAQLEGSIIWSVTAAMWGEINIEEGRVAQSNFHDYRLMRINEMPQVETILSPTGGFWGGVGEPGQAPVIPALCNAIYAATGRRIRSLPLKHHGFSLA